MTLEPGRFGPFPGLAQFSVSLFFVAVLCSAPVLGQERGFAARIFPSDRPSKPRLFIEEAKKTYPWSLTGEVDHSPDGTVWKPLAGYTTASGLDAIRLGVAHSAGAADAYLISGKHVFSGIPFRLVAAASYKEKPGKSRLLAGSLTTAWPMGKFTLVPTAAWLQSGAHGSQAVGDFAPDLELDYDFTDSLGVSYDYSFRNKVGGAGSGEFDLQFTATERLSFQGGVGAGSSFLAKAIFKF